MKKFIIRVLAGFIVLMGIMYSIQFLYHKYSRNDDTDTRKFYNMPNQINIANMGNSHGLCSFNYADLQDEYVCFNFALTAQSIEYDEGIMKQYINRMADNSVMIIPVSYVTFFLSDWNFSDEFFNVKNQRYYGILSYKNMIRTNLVEYIKRKYFAFIYTDVRADMISAIDEKFFINQPDKDGEDIPKTDFAKDAYDAYNRHVASFLIDGEYQFKDELVKCLYNMINMCRENNVTPVLVTTPCVKEYNDYVEKEFLSEFNEILSKVIEDTQVPYYNYCNDERFVNRYDLFMNADHLNEEGAAIFTDIFYEECLKTILE